MLTMKKVTILFVVLCILGSSVGKSLPSYINMCSLKDPEINNCIKIEANKLIPKMIHGLPKLHVPSFNPFILEKLEASIGKLNLIMKDIQIFGLENSVVDDVAIDIPNNKLKIKVVLPEVLLKSIYTMNGRVLVLPVEGTGPMEIKMKDATFQADCTFENAQLNSKEPMKFVDSVLDYQYNDIHLHFDNLFNGNKELGDPVNKLLNEQHSAINKDFHPIFIELINTVVKSVINQIFQDFYANDIFKE